MVLYLVCILCEELKSKLDYFCKFGVFIEFVHLEKKYFKQSNIFTFCSKYERFYLLVCNYSYVLHFM